MMRRIVAALVGYAALLLGHDLAEPALGLAWLVVLEAGSLVAAGVATVATRAVALVGEADRWFEAVFAGAVVLMTVGVALLARWLLLPLTDECAPTASTGPRAPVIELDERRRQEHGEARTVA